MTIYFRNTNFCFFFILTEWLEKTVLIYYREYLVHLTQEYTADMAFTEEKTFYDLFHSSWLNLFCKSHKIETILCNILIFEWGIL